MICEASVTILHFPSSFFPSLKFMGVFLHPAKQGKQPGKWEVVVMKGFSPTSIMESMEVAHQNATSNAPPPPADVKASPLSTCRPFLNWFQQHQDREILC